MEGKVFETDLQNLEEFVKNPFAMQEKISNEADRISAMLDEADEMSEKELLRRARQIKPLVRVAEDGCAVFNPQNASAKQFFVKPTDITDSFTFSFTMDKIVKDDNGEPLSVEVCGLYQIAQFICYHRYGGFYGILQPSTDEVLKQIPKQFPLDDIAAFDVVFPTNDVSACYNRELDVHVSLVTVYGMRRSLPEQIKNQDVIISGKFYPYTKFDVLCHYAGKDVRIPLEQADLETAWAIFPTESNVYLSFTEVSMGFRFCVREEEIPRKEFFEGIFIFKDEINMILKDLGYPIIEGLYFANPRTNVKDGNNCVVNFCNHPSSQVYGNEKRAKCRFVGTFNG